MIAVPVKSGGHPVLILVLQKENLVRLQQADPIDIETADYIGAGPKLLIAYEEDDAKLAQFAKKGDIRGLVEYLERGRTVYEGEVQPPKKWNPE